MDFPTELITARNTVHLISSSDHISHVYLSANGPPKPPYICRVSEETVDTTGDQAMVVMLDVLHIVVEIPACGEHAGFAQGLTAKGQEKADDVQHPQLFHACIWEHVLISIVLSGNFLAHKQSLV